MLATKYLAYYFCLLSPESPNFSAALLPPDRIQAEVARIEKKRDDYLRSRQVIGRVTEGAHRDLTMRINVRKVNFKWQRGTKIGKCRHSMYEYNLATQVVAK